MLNFFCLRSRGSAADEKRKQDARIAQLEEELEEERTQNELLMEKYKRANMQVCGKSCDQLELINAAWVKLNSLCIIFILQQQMEQFQTDLNSERAALQKMEGAKLTLEKQVRETNDRPVTPCGFSAIFSVNGVPFVTLDFPWNQRQNHLFIPLFINFFLIYLFC